MNRTAKNSVLILGGSGMLGSMVASVLAEDPSLEVGATVRTPQLSELGKRRLPNVRWTVFDAGLDQPVWKGLESYDWIVNAVGVTKPFIREDQAADTQRAIRINSLFPHHLASFSASTGAKVIQIATDCVFAGAAGDSRESTQHDPIDVYGKTKSLGEVRGKGYHHFRCSIVGPEPKGGRYLLHWLLSQPRGSSVKGFVDQLWNGVTTFHFARLCSGAIKANVPLKHMQHVLPADSLSKAQLLRLFCRSYGRPDIVVEDVQSQTPANRVLGTDDAALNELLWKSAGYQRPLSISEMVSEMASYDFKLSGFGDLAEAVSGESSR
jgi:dTDP-4-dehydrorhamnose reductase